MISSKMMAMHFFKIIFWDLFFGYIVFLMSNLFGLSGLCWFIQYSYIF